MPGSLPPVPFFTAHRPARKQLSKPAASVLSKQLMSYVKQQERTWWRIQTHTMPFQRPHILETVFKKQPSHHSNATTGDRVSVPASLTLHSTTLVPVQQHTYLSTETQDLSLEEALSRTAKKNKASKGNGRLSDILATMVMDIQNCPEETSFQQNHKNNKAEPSAKCKVFTHRTKAVSKPESKNSNQVLLYTPACSSTEH